MLPTSMIKFYDKLTHIKDDEEKFKKNFLRGLYSYAFKIYFLFHFVQKLELDHKKLISILPSFRYHKSQTKEFHRMEQLNFRFKDKELNKIDTIKFLEDNIPNIENRFGKIDCRYTYDQEKIYFSMFITNIDLIKSSYISNSLGEEI